MKTSTLSTLLVALIATPQSSLGRSIPRGLQKDQRSVEPNGPDAAYWNRVDAGSNDRNLGLAITLNAPSKRGLPFLPKLPGSRTPDRPDGTPGGSTPGDGTGGVGRAGAGVGAGSVGVGAPGPNIGPGAPRPAAGGLGQYGEPPLALTRVAAPTQVAAPAPLPTKHDRPSSGSSSDSDTAPDPTRPRVGPGPLSPALPGGRNPNPNPFPNLNPPAPAPAQAAAAAGRSPMPQVAIDRNRNAPGGVFNLKNHGGYTVTTREEDFFGNSLEVTINNHVYPFKRVGLIRIDKADKSIDVDDVRFSEEKDKITQKVVAQADRTPDRARGFEVITSSWVHEAGMDIRQLKRLNYDSVEEDRTKDIIKRLIPFAGDTPPGTAVGSPSSDPRPVTPAPGTSGSGSPASSSGSGSDSTIVKKTYIREKPEDAAAFNELLNSGLGVLALDIIQFTPIGKQVQKIVIGRDSESPKSNPSFEILFDA